MILAMRTVTIAGDTADVHARLESGVVAWCGVYVRPAPSTIDPTAALRPGYWYFPASPMAETILHSLGVTVASAMLNKNLDEDANV